MTSARMFTIYEEGGQFWVQIVVDGLVYGNLAPPFDTREEAEEAILRATEPNSPNP